MSDDYKRILDIFRQYTINSYIMLRVSNPIPIHFIHLFLHTTKRTAIAKCIESKFPTRTRYLKLFRFIRVINYEKQLKIRKHFFFK